MDLDTFTKKLTVFQAKACSISSQEAASKDWEELLPLLTAEEVCKLKVAWKCFVYEGSTQDLNHTCKEILRYRRALNEKNKNEISCSNNS